MNKLKDELFSISGTTSEMCEEILKWTESLPVRMVDVHDVNVVIEKGVIFVERKK